MIVKSYSIYCDECTKNQPLYGQTIEECEAEAKNLGWTTKKPHWYCPACSLKMTKQASNPQETQESAE